MKERCVSERGKEKEKKKGKEELLLLRESPSHLSSLCSQGRLFTGGLIITALMTDYEAGPVMC